MAVRFTGHVDLPVQDEAHDELSDPALWEDLMTLLDRIEDVAYRHRLLLIQEAIG